jgi:flavin-binding protein dodecin
MAHHVYKKMEMVGTSGIGSDDAIQNALNRAAKTVRNLRWFEVVELRGAIDGAKVGEWQVTLNIGFTLEE